MSADARAVRPLSGSLNVACERSSIVVLLVVIAVVLVEDHHTDCRT